MVGFGVLFVATAHGAESDAGSPAVFNFVESLGTGIRFTLYGLILLGLCLVSLAVPDALLLACVFAMPTVEFTGFRVALMVLQCVMVWVKTGSARSFVPSWPMGVFLLCVVASVSWGLYPEESLLDRTTGICAMLLLLPLMIATRALLHTRLTTPGRLLWALTLGCIPGCVLLVKNALAGVVYSVGGEGYYMGFIIPDIFSPMLVMSGLFLLMNFASGTVPTKRRIIAGLLLAPICLALLLSGIRSGWVGFACGVLLLLVQTRRFSAMAAIAGIVVVVGFLGFYSPIDLRLKEKLAARVSERSLATGEQRLQYWEIAAKGFLQRPVLGIGWGSFPRFAADNTIGDEVAAHNVFVRILCELGAVGLATFGLWIVTSLRRARHRSAGTLAGLLMAGVLVQGFFLDHFLCSYFWLFLGVCDGIQTHALASSSEPGEVYAGAPGEPLVSSTT